MTKIRTSLILYDDAFQISITLLKKWGYLISNHHRSGVITWKNEDSKIASVSFTTNTLEQPYIELNYTCDGKHRKYKVNLVSVPSNLGKGVIWYFLCPKTEKRCRKLYLIDGCFLHREAFTGCAYESQTRNKKWRHLDNVYGPYFDLDRCYMEIYSKHFKTHYNGKPTKRYFKLLEKINRGNRVDYRKIKLLMNS